MAEFKLIGDLPEGPSELAGTELVEIQNGAGVGASQQTTTAKVASLANAYALAAAGNAQSAAETFATAAAAAAQAAAETFATNAVAAASDGGISASYGTPGGAALTTAESITGLATSGYNLTGWQIQCSPAGSITVDFRIASLGNPTASLIGTGNAPTINDGTSNAATIEGWNSVNVPRGSVIEFIITAVTAVEWYNVALLGNRT